MAKFDAKKISEYIKKSKQPLLVTGSGCDNIQLNGKKLIDYAVQIAEKLNCPVAATGNTVLTFNKNNKLKVKKMWLAEIFRYLEDGWEDPLLAKKPDILILIGYNPEMIDGMVGNTAKIKTVFLGPGRLCSANKSTGEVTMKEWKQNLEELIKAL